MARSKRALGVAVGDYKLDGNLDIFKTHFADDTNVLYRNDGGANFTDVTIAAGFGVETRYICWGTGFADFDNDGWPDLAVVTGSVYPEVEAQFSDYPLKTPRFIFRNLGNGKFEELIDEAGPGIAARIAANRTRERHIYRLLNRTFDTKRCCSHSPWVSVQSCILPIDGFAENVFWNAPGWGELRPH
jgi:FG-GAP-like repeat